MVITKKYIENKRYKNNTYNSDNLFDVVLVV